MCLNDIYTPCNPNFLLALFFYVGVRFGILTKEVLNMELKFEVLQEALREMVDFKGYTHREITDASGVHNIGRIIKGSQAPYLRSWEALRKAYPEHIP